MTTLLLIRHGRTNANASGLLAGWTPGVDLDDVGQKQAAQIARNLSGINLAAVVTSPLPRCQQTVAALSQVQAKTPTPIVDERLGECRYGDWTNRPLAELAQEPLWQTVQRQPSVAKFPGGESLAAVYARANAAISDWNMRVATEYGDEAVWLACSHEDVLKTIVAHTIGVHLDLFQRITISHAAVTVIRLTPDRPYLLCLNNTGEQLSQLFASTSVRKV